MIDLLPCPFCGAEDWLVEACSLPLSFWVFCTSCGAKGPVSTESFEEAELKWNDQWALPKYTNEIDPDE